ncbi:VWA domain-containing protein [Telmatospirillum sp.]|uniref:VWA domain-containing protein n=1 Tax=Telmatospirillum sp. TaxID=2079197 RepID=UPI00284AA75E|nr:VWA domain-containing protein [Telmatospirillum sp.]MDR3436916.1 VWA domain-containing protein [Telmatospirillum sp.]
MSNNDRSLRVPSSSTEVDAFLNKLADLPAAADGGRGRLMFALDATASREATWLEATHIQEQMFVETAALGGLEVQLVYYRGIGECKASRWLSDAQALMEVMQKVSCDAGRTQIARVLLHAVAQTEKVRLGALVFVGDCMEENLEDLLHAAGQLRLLGVPVFLFHEGNDPVAGMAFAKIAALTKGACCKFDTSSPAQLRSLLAAVAVYAAGGRKALTEYGQRQGGAVLQLTRQMSGD